jgi:flagellar hook assembly protein FlgD
VTLMSSPFPNPFRGSTSLRLAMARDGKANVAIYDVVGRRVRTLVDGQKPAGEWTLVWDGRDDGGRAVPSGLYLVRFLGDGVEQSRRIILTQ